MKTSISVDKSDLFLHELKEISISQGCALVQTSDSLEMITVLHLRVFKEC